jgi:hypothetical protein
MMTLERPSILQILLMIAVMRPLGARGADSNLSPTLPADDRQTQLQLLNDLRDADHDKITSSVREIFKRLTSGDSSLSQRFWDMCFPLLMEDKRYNDVADISLEMILVRPETLSSSVMTSMPPAIWRVQAFLAAGKPQAALEAAKSNYNACSFDRTPDAVALAAYCFARCHPDDPTISERFEREQATASFPRAYAAPIYASGGSVTPTSMLKLVKIDGGIYKFAIQENSTRTKFSDLVQYGGLLLAADRNEDAEKLFRRLCGTATNANNLAVAIEGVARAIRAEDGNVARANAFLNSLQEVSRVSER